MKRLTFVMPPALVLVSLLQALPARGTRLYVDVNSTNAVPPYTNWATAAITIQDAVDAASAGDAVYVASGVYSNGFGINAPVAGNSNRVSITKPIRVSSVDGPETTIIQGSGPVGTNGVRCVYLTNGATLAGFTLRGGAAYHFGANLGGGGAFVEGGSTLEGCMVTGGNAGSGYGGGVYVRTNGLIVATTIVSNFAAYGGGAYLAGANARIQNSTISTNGNDSTSYGGGVYLYQTGLVDRCTIESNNGGNGGGVYLRQGGSVSNCVIRFNRCRSDGGGVQCYYGGLVDRCTIARNAATVTGVGHGAGADLIGGGLLRNSLVFSNTATYYGGGVRLIYGGTVESCTVVGNISTNLSLAEGGGLACWWSGTVERIRVRNSIIWGNASASGEPNWDDYGGSPASVFEYCCTTSTNGLPGGIGCFDADPLFEDPLASDYRPGSGSLCINGGKNQTWMVGARDLPGRVRIIEDIVDLGAYEVGTSVLHVWTNSPSPMWPYGSWATAAHVIQDAIDEAVDGDVVLATNGVYTTGGAVMPMAGGWEEMLTNRVMINKAIRVLSVNGWEHTFILGHGDGPGGTSYGSGAVRGAYVGTNATLSGFTITNGYTGYAMALPGLDYEGGGVLGSGTGPGAGAVTNCHIIGNHGHLFGGGASSAILLNCLISDNYSWAGGGVTACQLHYCDLRSNMAESAGGAWQSALFNCLVVSNAAINENGRGGGAAFSSLHNCLLTGNSAAFGGGTSQMSNVVASTLYGNVAAQSGGGSYQDQCVWNSIIYGNTAATNSNMELLTLADVSHCCTYPLPEVGSGHITNEPAFVNATAGNYCLRYGSSCIDTGTNRSTAPTNDFTGQPRPVDGDFDGVEAYDIGAYEYNPATYDSDGDGMPDGWEHGYGLNPTNALDAAENPDADAHNNFEEYVADTNPTNDLSCLRIIALSNLPSWTVYFWPSSTNRFYTLESSTNLANAGWSNVAGQVRVPGTGGTQSMNDTNTGASHFYRVGAGP